MRTVPLTSLVFLLSVVRSLGALSVVSDPRSRFRVRHSSYHSLGVLDATNAKLEIANKVIAPDGFSRNASLAGGTFPGPLIKARKGQNFSINVVNNLSDPTMELTTTIHWHGINQNRSNWADGVAFITQCPIQPGHNFLYRFNPENQAGTFWYHSHHGVQYCDGVRGPLVIYDPHDPHSHLYDVDNEHTVITLSDWWHLRASQLTRPYTADAILINGKGRYSGGPETPLSVVDVEYGKRYRLRIVGTSCDSWFNFTIHGHRMSIIEVDGKETVPEDVDWLQVLAGQRYSVVLAANQAPDNYWIRALPSHGNQTFIGGQNSAILRYVGASVREPTTIQNPAVVHFEESRLRPLHSAPAPGVPELGKADIVLNLVANYDGASDSFSINGRRFTPPPAPVLLQILSGARHPRELLPIGSVFELPRNKVVELHIPANDLTPGGAVGGPHSFYVVRSATNSTPNFANPLVRDTVSMGSEAQHSNITIRFVTDNPGPWILHCHIDFHLTSGFALMMAEALETAAAQQKEVVPTGWKDLCPVEIQQATALFNNLSGFNISAFNFTSTRRLAASSTPSLGASSAAGSISPSPSFGAIFTTSQSISSTASSPASSAVPTLSEPPVLNWTGCHTDISTMPPTFSSLSKLL